MDNFDNFVDYYELLHVQDTAPAAVIKASYRAMMQKLKNHPDFGGDVSFAQQLNDAIKILCNPQARASYDEVRASHLAARKAQSSSASSDPDSASHRRPEWGAPGGSPHGYQPGRQERKLTDKQRSGHARTNADGDSANDINGPENADTERTATLPARAQCPFCHAPYPIVDKSRHGVYANSHRCKTCNGATAAIKPANEPVSLASDDHARRIHRQLHETAARVWLGWPSEPISASRLNDFSPTGCALRIMDPVSVGHCIMIETQLFNAICRVRHCGRPLDNASYVVGVEFLTLDIVALRGSLLNATA